MIKCLLTELGRAGRENILPSVMAHGPRCARSVRHDLGPNIFPSGPPTQSISTYYGKDSIRTSRANDPGFRSLYSPFKGRVVGWKNHKSKNRYPAAAPDDSIMVTQAMNMTSPLGHRREKF